MLQNARKTVLSGAIGAIKRFPVPSLLSLLLFFPVAAFVHAVFGAIFFRDASKFDPEPLYFIILFYGFFWFIALKLFSESHGWRAWFYYGVGIPVFLAMAWQFYSVADYLPAPFVYLGAGLFLGIFTAPFLTSKSDSMQVWVFHYRVWLNLCFVVLAAVTLSLGLAAIFGSLYYLFGIKLYDEIYFYTFMAIATPFLPILFLAGIPARFDVAEENFPKAIQAIFSYIALPLLLVYAVILYGYAAKILFTWDLPKGGVVYMVSAFSCMGVIAYLGSYPLHRDQGLIALFGRHFFKILLVPLVLLAVGIGVRIREYGITEERYAVLLCFIWLSLSGFFGLTKHSSQAPKFISSSLFLLFLIAAFGPLSAVNISAWSQTSRLEALLVNNRMLVDNQLKHPEQALSLADRISISSIMDYIVKTRKTDYLRPWLVNIPDAKALAQHEGYSAKEIVQDMGVDYIEPADRPRYSDAGDKRVSNKFNFYSDFENPPYTAISGYDYFVSIGQYAIDQSGFADNFELVEGGTELAVKFEPISNSFTVKASTSEKLVFDLEEMIKRLHREKDKNLHSNKQLFIMEKHVSGLSARLIVTRISGEFGADDKKSTITGFSSKLLVKNN